MTTLIKTPRSLAAIVGSVLIGLNSAPGASFNANPTMDAFVSTGPTGNLVNNNYGGAGSLSLSAAGLEMGELQTVLQFNLGGAVSAFNAQYGAGQWHIQSVSLQLTYANANNPVFNSPAPGTFGISWMQNDGWQEGTGRPESPGTTGITFASLQSTFMGPNDESLGAFSFNGSTSGANTYNLALSAGLLADIAGGDNVSLRLFAADGTVSGVFNSRSFSIAANRPVLTVVAIPEPGTITLVALGLAGTFVYGFRRRSASS